MLVQLLYASRALVPVTGEVASSILEASFRNNRAVNVGGTLFVGAGYFMQCLEGPRDAVNDTYARILRDPRHSRLTLLQYERIVQRRYAGWAMNYISEREAVHGILQRFMLEDRFDPFALDGTQAKTLLEALHENAINHSASRRFRRSLIAGLQ